MEKIRIYRLFSKLVRITSILVVASILATLFYVLSEKEKIEQTDETSKKNDEKYEAYIQNPLIKGFSKDLKPYEIGAEKLVKNHDLFYDLSSIKAKYALGDGLLSLSSQSGILNEARDYLKLYGSIDVLFNDIKLEADFLNFDLKNQFLEGDKGVYIHYKNSLIKADNFLYKDSNKTLNLNGRVKAKINLSDF